MKKRITFFFFFLMIMGLFSGCGNKTLSGEPYTLTVTTDATDTQEWSVRYDRNGVVSHVVTSRDDGKTDVVFTGLQKGKVNATVSRIVKGKTMSYADEAYVLTLLVDRKGNVTESTPQYGAYTVDCGQGISGSEWVIECEDGNVRWNGHQNLIKQDGDGMQGYTMRYSFTGKRPGASHVLVQTYLPWCNVYEPMRDLWLYVDSEYRVSELKMTDFESFRLEERGMRAECLVLEAQKTETGVKLADFDEVSRWSNETNDYETSRLNESTADGDELLYRSVAGLLTECNIKKWDGFNKSNLHVLDGKMFTFTATLADGSRIYATGSNSFPDGYSTLCNTLRIYIQQTQRE